MWKLGHIIEIKGPYNQNSSIINIVDINLKKNM